jgi:hypothetical protein
MTSHTMSEVFQHLQFTAREVRDLMRATERQCTCSIGRGGDVLEECSAHRRLSDVDALKRVLFGRRLADRLRAEEFTTPTRLVVDRGERAAHAAGALAGAIQAESQ